MKEIVFIDDDMRRMRYYAEYLELEGYRLVRFEDDELAIRYIEEKRSDIALVILDMIMPSTIFSKEETSSYYDTGKHLLARARKALPKVPVIIFSIRNDIRAMPGIKELGINAVLVKDETTPPKLAEVINKIIGAP
jgi:CheY-like chemotaxis protein